MNETAVALTCIKRTFKYYVNEENQNSTFTYCTISLVVFLEIIFKAINVPLTHDEIATFHHYVQRAEFIPFISSADGNNHFLNTFFIYLFYKLFGYSAFVIRLPNLIFFIVYCFFVWKLSTLLKSFWLKLLLWIGLLFCLHFVEFFALARGYGMGYSFLIAGLWFHFKAERTNYIRNYYLIIICLVLASLSLLTLTFSLALYLFWFITREFYKPKLNRRTFRRFLFSTLIPALIILVVLSLKVRATGGYIEGSKGDFLQISISSLFRVLFDLNFIYANRLTYLIVLIIILIFTGLIIEVLIRTKKQTELYDSRLIFIFLLLGNVALTLISNYFFGLNFPETRMAVYFYPLIILSLIFTLEYPDNKKVRYVYWVLVPMLYLPFHFLTHARSNFSVWYQYCYIPERFYDRVMREYNPDLNPSTIGGHGTQAYAWSALVKENKGKANLMETSGFPANYTDYQILEIKYFPQWQENFDTIDYEKISNLHLLKRKSQAGFQEIRPIKVIAASHTTRQEHLVLYDTLVHEWQGKHLRLDYDFSLETRQPFIAMVACSVEDEERNNLMFNTIQFNLLAETWDGTEHNFKKSMLFQLPEKSAHLSIIIWNLEKTSYNLKAGTITFSELCP